MSRFAIAIGIAVLAAMSTGAAGQAPKPAGAAATAPAAAKACLHGAAEKPAQRTRRLAALEFVKKVNLLEGAGHFQAQRYFMIEDLPTLPPVPQGFKVTMSNDGASYAFSAKDTQDPCSFAYFSDQDNVVYAATPVR
jgi:hypothetical protein